jgi:hypothetical protein
MIRIGTLIWMAAVALVGYAMFQVKYEVVQQEEQLARLNRQIADGREAIRVLNAEWSFLSQPARLNELAKRYLTLVPIGTAQLLNNLDALPMRPAGATAADTAGRMFAPLAPTKVSAER